jgi:starch synthase
VRAAVVEILFVAPEVTPYSRTGSIGDACAALPKALRGLGHRVTVVSPLYRGIDATQHALARRLSPLVVDVGGTSTKCFVFDGRTTGGVELVFVSHEALESPAWGDRDASARARGAALFAAAAVEVAHGREPAVEIVHAHGWFGAPALAAAARSLPHAGRVLSLHGATDAAAIADAAQRVIAGSQSEAAALMANGGANAPGAQVFAQGRLVGIADGLDAARWNPLTDSHLPVRFDPVNLEGKTRCKDQLQLDSGLPVRADAPLVAAVLEDAVAAGTAGTGEGGAGAAPTGAARLAAAAAEAVRNDVQLLVIGGASVAELAALAEKYPDRVALTPPADEKLLHRALAASDLVLLPAPSFREAGIVAAALRYGAVPIAHRAGAAADALVDCDAKLETGTAFVLEGEEAGEMAEAIARAVAGYALPERFSALRRKVMRLDLSWERSARRHEHVYKGVLANA